VTYAMICNWTVMSAERMDLPGAQKRHSHIEGWHMHDGAVARWTRAFVRHWLGPAENEGEFAPAE
jgi:GMP synthase (glutamine-hydrolysing)